MPCGVKLDLVDAVAMAVVGAQHRWERVCLGCPVRRLRRAGETSQRMKSRQRCCSAKPLDRINQCRIAAEDVVVDEGPRLVDHVVRAHSITVRLGLSTAALHCRFLSVGSTTIEHMFENEFEGKPGPELFGELASMNVSTLHPIERSWALTADEANGVVAGRSTVPVAARARIRFRALPGRGKRGGRGDGRAPGVGLCRGATRAAGTVCRTSTCAVGGARVRTARGAARAPVVPAPGGTGYPGGGSRGGPRVCR